MSLYTVSKRAFDIFLCIPAIILLLPVFCVLAFLLRLGSKGPAIFKQERAGKGGKPFIFYKFRTMKLDSEPFGPSPKGGGDPRLTKIGRFLREYSLDELPQLFNIVKGDMSLVGPRGEDATARQARLDRFGPDIRARRAETGRKT